MTQLCVNLHPQDVVPGCASRDAARARRTRGSHVSSHPSAGILSACPFCRAGFKKGKDGRRSPASSTPAVSSSPAQENPCCRSLLSGTRQQSTRGLDPPCPTIHAHACCTRPIDGDDEAFRTFTIPAPGQSHPSTLSPTAPTFYLGPHPLKGPGSEISSCASRPCPPPAPIRPGSSTRPRVLHPLRHEHTSSFTVCGAPPWANWTRDRARDLDPRRAPVHFPPHPLAGPSTPPENIQNHDWSRRLSLLGSQRQNSGSEARPAQQ